MVKVAISNFWLDIDGDMVILKRKSVGPLSNLSNSSLWFTRCFQTDFSLPQISTQKFLSQWPANQQKGKVQKGKHNIVIFLENFVIFLS